MVAVIKTGHSVQRILNYNENKVKEGIAECISASNYPADTEKLSFTQKLNRLLKQTDLNENVSRNSVHISLNFDPKGHQLSGEQLKEIAETYMQKIGFGEQPYLVYQHFDAGHPHIHIVSVKVRSDGSRIDMQNIGRNQSEKARKEIEILFQLKKAGDNKQGEAFELKPAYTARVQYSRSETKRAITNVLDAVLKNYKYSSLPELNAVLQQYNVLADRGKENSRIFKNNGLVYRIIDGQGNKVGVPIKASDFYGKPTLKFLEERFVLNEPAKQQQRARVKNAVDLCLFRQSRLPLQDLIRSLEKQGIRTVLRQNTEGIIYGITYVDHQTRCVFNGSDLGKQYSAKSIQERCEGSAQSVAVKEQFFKHQKTITEEQPMANQSSKIENKETLLETLLKPEYWSAYVPHQLTKNSRKKKKNAFQKGCNHLKK